MPWNVFYGTFVVGRCQNGGFPTFACKHFRKKQRTKSKALVSDQKITPLTIILCSNRARIRILYNMVCWQNFCLSQSKLSENSKKMSSNYCTEDSHPASILVGFTFTNSLIIKKMSTYLSFWKNETFLGKLWCGKE